MDLPLSLRENDPATRGKLPPGRVTGIALLLFLFALICVFPTYILLSNIRYDTSDWRDPYLPDDARELTSQDFGDFGTSTEVRKMSLMELTTYTTSASPEQVYSFYRAKYSESLWEPSGERSRFKELGDRLNFYKHKGQTSYYVDINAYVNAAGETDVEVGASMSPDR